MRFFFANSSENTITNNSEVLTPSLFQLVSTDANGIVLPLPAELGPLPLYPQSDGFYSVLGPPITHVIHEAEVNGSTNDPHTLAYNPTLTPSRGNVFCGSSNCSGNRFAPTPLPPFRPSARLSFFHTD